MFPVPVSVWAQEPRSCPRARLALSTRSLFADCVSSGAAVLQALLLSLQEHQAQVGSTLAAVLAAGRSLSLTLGLRTFLDASVSGGADMEHFLGCLQSPLPFRESRSSRMVGSLVPASAKVGNTAARACGWTCILLIFWSWKGRATPPGSMLWS